MCSHDPIFGTIKIGSLKTDRVNGPLERSENAHKYVESRSLTVTHIEICLFK